MLIDIADVASVLADTIALTAIAWMSFRMCLVPITQLCAADRSC